MSIISATNKFTSISCNWLFPMIYVNAIRPASHTTPWQLHSRNLQWFLKLLIWTKLRQWATNFFVSSTSFLRTFLRNGGTILLSPSSRVSEFIYWYKEEIILINLWLCWHHEKDECSDLFENFSFGIFGNLKIIRWKLESFG